jgi:hypothetical protein
MIILTDVDYVGCKKTFVPVFNNPVNYCAGGAVSADGAVTVILCRSQGSHTHPRILLLTEPPACASISFLVTPLL